jgi:hypothetical protein
LEYQQNQSKILSLDREFQTLSDTIASMQKKSQILLTKMNEFEIEDDGLLQSFRNIKEETLVKTKLLEEKFNIATSILETKKLPKSLNNQLTRNIIIIGLW